jgi:hypothetical protein
LEVEDVLEAEATAAALEDHDREESDEYAAFSAGMFKAVLPSLCRGLTSLLRPVAAVRGEWQPQPLKHTPGSSGVSVPGC